ncbi:hypothetical protein BC833DRAFT_603866 [Globomyces pollinis-pini]|nr:hypothetical protein BC833DRAFT_603866 [Globomyces pollinis-pini]
MTFDIIRKVVIKKYEGNINSETGQYDGLGSAVFYSNDKYTGDFHDGLLHGKGKYEWSDGVIYEGDLKENKISGEGVYRWKNGMKYTGSLLNSLRHGFGHLQTNITNTQFYDGEWENGSASGKGTCQLTSGKYIGEYKDSMRHGKGKMIYSSGNIYEGEWNNNRKVGFGKMTWTTTNEEYEGEWDNIPHGQGTYTWKLNRIRDHQFPCENMYKGNWVDGKRHGFGIFYYSDGSRYEGNWKENKKEGQGVYISSNGRVYNGIFINDKIKEGFEQFSNEIPYVFHLPKEFKSKQEETLRGLNAVIFRNSAFLRDIYHHYCLQTRKIPGYENKHVLSRSVLWHMLIECKTNMKGVSLASLDREYSKMFQEDPIHGNKYLDPHNPLMEFIFYDYLDYLVSVSYQIYKDFNQLSIHENRLAGCLEYFIKNDMMKNVNLDAFILTLLGDNKLFNSLLLEISKSHQPLMIEVYREICHRTPKSLPNSPCDLVITYREFLLMLKEYHIFAKYSKTLTISKLINVLQLLLPTIVEGNSINLELEMTLYGFEACFGLCINLALRQPIESRINGTNTTKVVDTVVSDTTEERERVVLVRRESIAKGKKTGESTWGKAIKSAEVVEVIKRPTNSSNKGRLVHQKSTGKTQHGDIKEDDHTINALVIDEENPLSKQFTS